MACVCSVLEQLHSLTPSSASTSSQGSLIARRLRLQAYQLSHIVMTAATNMLLALLCLTNALFYYFAYALMQKQTIQVQLLELHHDELARLKWALLKVHGHRWK